MLIRLCTWRMDMTMAIGLLSLSLILGFIFHWHMVQDSFEGSLQAQLIRSVRNGEKCNSREYKLWI